MKKVLSLFISIMCSFILVAQEKMYIHKSDNMTLGAFIAATDSIYFNTAHTMAYFTINDSVTQYAVSEIDSINFGPNSDTVFVTYNGSSVSVINPLAFEGVMVTVNGAHVTVKSTIPTSNIYYMLSGTTTDGMFRITSDKRFNLLMNGVNITNPDGPAINVQSGSKVTATLLDGTSSTLTDGLTYAAAPLDSLGLPEDQKAAFFSEGQLLFIGTGSLNIAGKGTSQSALCSDDYIQVDNGTITVTSAVNDGVHGKEGVFINGGTLNVTATGDAIDGDEGEVLITGGNIITVNAAADVKGITCDSTLTISGGSILMTISGNQSKGIQSGQNMNLSGGTIVINTSGQAVLVASGSGFDPSYCAGIKCDSNITVSGASITITSTGKAGKGISGDKNIDIISGYLKITCSGVGATYTNTSGTADAYTSTDISCNGSLTILGDSVIVSNSGSGGKGFSIDGTLTIGNTNSNPVVKVTTTGTKITVSSGNYAEAKAVKTNGTVIINSGTTTITSADDGIKSETSVIINNGTVNVTSKEGIESPVITVNNGNVNIVATDDGFNATHGNGGETNDGSLLTINGGNVAVNASGGDGLDSNGNIVITGGTTVVHGPQSQPEVGMDYNGTCNISGGLLVISGTNSNMTQATSTTSAQYCIKATTTTSVAANTLFHVETSTGTSLLTFKPVRSYYSVVFSSPSITNGASLKIYTGGTTTGTNNNGLYTGGTYSGGTLKKTFTVSGKVTNVTF